MKSPFELPQGATCEHSEHELGGNHWKIVFPNRRGASIVDGWFAYKDPEHPYELAVLDARGALDYSTPVTSDVRGHLNLQDVNELLAQIAALPLAFRSEP